jgi:hypothetical protein
LGSFSSPVRQSAFPVSQNYKKLPDESNMIYDYAFGLSNNLQGGNLKK